MARRKQQKKAIHGPKGKKSLTTPFTQNNTLQIQFVQMDCWLQNKNSMCKLMYNTTFIENISQISHMENLIENIDFFYGLKNL